jgi:hypothetical protein
LTEQLAGGHPVAVAPRSCSERSAATPPELIAERGTVNSTT